LPSQFVVEAVELFCAKAPPKIVGGELRDKALLRDTAADERSRPEEQRIESCLEGLERPCSASSGQT